MASIRRDSGDSRLRRQSLDEIRVRIYTAPGCGLCGAAVEAVRQVCGDDFELIDISGQPELEARYRESIPVVEIDGERAFTYFVQPEALRRRLGERDR